MVIRLGMSLGRRAGGHQTLGSFDQSTSNIAGGNDISKHTWRLILGSIGL